MRYGQHAVTMAFTGLTMLDKDSGLTVLRPEARKAAWQLLGRPLEHPYYDQYWEGRTPPAEHQPPPEEDPKPSKKTGRGR